MKKYLIVIIAILLTGCGMSGDTGMMGGEENGMMARHHAQVPAEYVGMSAPAVTDEALINGAAIYTANCATCHGETGMGDGPTAAALDPAPAPISHTTQMLADDLLFYRVSEGGIPFQTTMPAWKDVLSEDQIWDVIAYVRVLGTDNAVQINEMRAAQQETMLASALSDGVITEEQANAFRIVHTALEETMGTAAAQGTMTERESAALIALVDSGRLTQAQVDEFQIVHALLANGGYMP